MCLMPDRRYAVNRTTKDVDGGWTWEPIPWCHIHDAQWGQADMCLARLLERFRAGRDRIERRYCRLQDPPQVFRATDER